MIESKGDKQWNLIKLVQQVEHGTYECMHGTFGIKF